MMMMMILIPHVKIELNRTTDATKIYKKNKIFFENIPNIESKMNKNEKFC